jgi:hypothetical protein
MPDVPYGGKLASEETLTLSKEERASFIAKIASHQAANNTCPTCGLHNPPEQLVCLRCQSDLVARDITANLGLGQSSPGERTRSVGDVLIATDKPITLEIGSTLLQLPVGPIVTLGRHATARDDKTVHVDLMPYGAWENGISRMHVEIRRKIMLCYIVDLGSTNGSILNGRRLYSLAEHLLRNGDRLQLSRMTLTVQF